MKLTHAIRLSFAIATLACAAPALAQGDAKTPATALLAAPAVAETRPPTLPEWNIANGSLMVAVEQLSVVLRSKNLPAINVVFAPEVRQAQVPEMVLQNVNGPDALRLLTVSAGCGMEEIGGTDGQTIGYRVFPTERFGIDPQAGAPRNPPEMIRRMADFPGPDPVAPAPGIPGAGPAPIYGGGGLPSVKEGVGSGFAPGIQGGVINFAGMPAPNPNTVSVYSLGAITNTTKFDDLQRTLLDILKTGGVSADAAKLAFHDKTNVLVVNAGADVQQMVTQFLDAMQKNVAAAAAEEKRSGNDRREVIEAMLRLDAERDERKRVTQQLEETEARFRDAQRELDRIKASAPKP